MTPNVPLIAWAPDADPTQPGVMVDVENLLPTERGYVPEKTATDIDVWTAPGRVHGAMTIYPYGSAMTLVGQASAIYRNFASFENVSRLSTYNTLGAFDFWSFAQFGDDITIASNDLNTMQSVSSIGSLGAKFADIAGAPAARHVVTQQNFVMAANFRSTTTPSWPYADGWWCSALANHASWTPDVATQAARGRLTQTPGGIEALVPFQNYVLAFKKRSMLRGTYVGQTAAGVIWRWDVISTGVGIVSPHAWCEAEGILYWLADDGFYAFAGGSIRRVPSPWFWFKAAALTGAVGGSLAQMKWDNQRRVVRVFYGNPNDASLPLSAGLTFHPETGRWGRFAASVDWAARLEQDSFIGASPRRHQTLTGAVLASSLTTGDIGDDDEMGVAMRARLRLLGTSGPTSTMTHYYRNTLDAALATGATATRTDGKYDISQAARWHRLKFAQTGADYEAMGFSVDFPKVGRR